jgi:hypothetical protein
MVIVFLIATGPQRFHGVFTAWAFAKRTDEVFAT